MTDESDEDVEEFYQQVNKFKIINVLDAYILLANPTIWLLIRKTNKRGNILLQCCQKQSVVVKICGSNSPQGDCIFKNVHRMA